MEPPCNGHYDDGVTTLPRCSSLVGCGRAGCPALDLRDGALTPAAQPAAPTDWQPQPDYTAARYAVRDSTRGYVVYDNGGHLHNGAVAPTPVTYAQAVRVAALWHQCGYNGCVVDLLARAAPDQPGTGPPPTQPSDPTLAALRQLVADWHRRAADAVLHGEPTDWYSTLCDLRDEMAAATGPANPASQGVRP